MENLLLQLQATYNAGFAEESALLLKLEEIKKSRLMQEGAIQILKLQEEQAKQEASSKTTTKE